MDNNRNIIIDFILTELNKKPQYDGECIDDLMDKFQKETGKTQDDQLWNKISRICEDDNLIERINNGYMYQITSKGLDIFFTHGSYLNFIKSQNDYDNRQKEIENLNFKVSQLQADNLEYQTKLREKTEEISTLDLKLKRLEFIQKWWWLLGVLVFIAGFVLRHLELLRF